MIEELAKAAHERYCDEARNRGETPETNSSLGRWEELSEDLKEANRAQVADIPNKMREIGWELVSTGGIQPDDLHLTPEQVDALAIREHNRWVEERRRHDWTWAPTRNNTLKQHPAMIEWEKLSEVDKQKDRNSVRQLSRLIERAGFRLNRISGSGGRSSGLALHIRL